MTADTPLFERIALIGIGLIGSSLARAVRQHGLAGHIAICTRSAETLAAAEKLELGDSYTQDAAVAAKDADLVVICVPMGAYGAVAEAIAPSLKAGAIVSDVGSTKKSAIDDLGPSIPDGVHLVPGHPIAGTEHSGPEHGFASLFENHWCILTPPDGTNSDAIDKMTRLWETCGSMVEIMDAAHHDQVLAITSHLPHLISYTIVGTATDLEDHLKKEVVKFAAGGFRDFTRIAASDPIMWRDIFLNNKDAVLDVLGRFTEDLTALQRAIRRGEADTLGDSFERTRDIRKGVIEAKQDFMDKEEE
ncbi:MAG: prephenate/arogenate dehydrogenase family protein [Rhodospirillaceae bacterium]|jgi:cyclohexadieny/prephenate dehydrogenase|nr:prephenate/arogenate dehydrogenase family protein [Alphaproteobacteria bacterium]MBT4219633.1 prephenate/arogenate dehydrogenase family protein [Rhodospirillaceae bacterium]MBT4464218.1 prephenate/arogenate dehydrogenase family protein [Rhodospirillaceae bacterium]MBT5013634.1 prephenate/arogenate dehydrogenase family protein [Rhodospirillaceae bacterium]MBT5308783.1 prephenate/arogenate dehydrogenase family protein [Rhodospirillaceae bacterium]